MKTAVRYYSRTGNTKIIAQAIGAAVGCQAESIEVPIDEEADILFLGGGIYWGKIPGALKEFIRNLPARKVKQIAVFSTAGLRNSATGLYLPFLRYYDLKVMKESFFCIGKRAFDETVKQEAGFFAEKIMAQAQQTLRFM